MPYFDFSSLKKHLINAWQKRATLVREQNLEAFRLIHGSADELPGLFVDVYSECFFLTPTEPNWFQTRTTLEKLLREITPDFSLNTPSFFWHQNYPHPLENPHPTPLKTLMIRENSLQFEVQLGKGRHTGLFLDQRDNRRRIRQTSQGKRTLNLFCYTGAFTINALEGGAKSVDSVDLSQNYLSWLERNLALNSLPQARSFLYRIDILNFLTSYREKSYDLIVLDPPTAFRSGKNHFSIVRSMAELLEKTCQKLAPNGKLFFSINTLKIPADEFQKQVRLAIKPLGMKILEYFSPPFDFPISPQEKDNPYLKSCLIGY